MTKCILWAFLGGLVYYAIEGFWRIPTNGGWANIFMLFVGGICFLPIGRINQIPRFFNLSMRMQSLIGACIAILVEFVAGCVLNIWLKMGIWDYSQMPFNIWGQVCLLYWVLWFFLMPLAIWLEDWLNFADWCIYGGEKPLFCYTLLDAYKELFIGKRI